jgi:hypothetical protein
MPEGTKRRATADRSRRVLVVLAVMALLAVASRYLPRRVPSHQVGSTSVESLYAQHLSGVWITAEGVAHRLLDDDTRGRRHQRFILLLASGHTLLVAHNIDLAARVPLAPGDRVTARGLYEWNPKGGVLHYTHLDPGGDGPGGWIRLRGESYQ